MLWGPLWPPWWVSPPLWGYRVLPTEALSLPQATALCPHRAGGTERLRGPAGWGPASICQEMGLGRREGDSEGGYKCLLLPKAGSGSRWDRVGGTAEMGGTGHGATTRGLYGVCSMGLRGVREDPEGHGTVTGL